MENNMKKINMLRKQYNYTYLDMAQILNCSKTYAWQLLTGKRRLSYEQAIFIAAIFNMKPDELFYTDFINNKITTKLKKINENKNQINSFKEKNK